MLKLNFRNRASWVAVFALVLFVSKTYFKFEIAEGDTLANLVLVLASTLGIFNQGEK